MANNLNCNPMYVDTATIGCTTVVVPQSSCPMEVEWILWSDIAASSDDLVIKDLSDNEIAVVKGRTSTPMDVLPGKIMVTNGMKVGKDSGTLHIYKK